MKKEKIRAAPTLYFSKEELENEQLKNSIHQTEKAEEKRNHMKSKLRESQKPNFSSAKEAPHSEVFSKPEPAGSFKTEKKPVPHRLHFEEDTVVPRNRTSRQGIIAKAASYEIDHQLSQDEEENTGLKVLHEAKKESETLLHAQKELHSFKIRHEQNHLIKAEKKLDQANIHFLQKAENIKTADKTGSNPLSRLHQRRMIKKEYLAAKSGKSTGNSFLLRRRAGKAVKKSSFSSGKAAGYFMRKKTGILLLLLFAMLAFTMNAISSCTPLVEAGLHSFVMGTYPAQEADILAAERAYTAKEHDLKTELEQYKTLHPGYDEYIIKPDKIWHDPHALTAIISAYKGGKEWIADDVYGILNILFEWQYVVSEEVTTQIRYRTEQQQGSRPVTDPFTGETRWENYVYEVSVPYRYTICTVTMENKNLSHAPVYIMSREKMGLYALYMSTLGNYPDLFSGNPYASHLKEPMIFEVPQELIDADPKFALLLEEANKRLGYPYVWGGYEPETSFDCSGFISWLFTVTQIDNIGHMGATALYDHGQPVRPEDAKPGDVIFFEGTMNNTDGITHCGLYVGNNMMIHCGNPCTYADLTDAYWQQHFHAFRRFYDHN